MKRLLLIFALLVGLTGCASIPTDKWAYEDPYSGLLEVQPRTELQLLYSNPNYGTSLAGEEGRETFQQGRVGYNSIGGGIGLMGVYRF